MFFKQSGNKRTWALFNSVIPFVLIAFGFLMSVILNPVLTEKYIFPSASLIILFISVAIGMVCFTKTAIFVLFVLCIFSYLNVEKTFTYIAQREKQTEKFKNISDLPEKGDFCVIINAIGEEKDDTAYARLYLGGRWDYSDVYLCTTKTEVLKLLAKDEAYVNSQQNK